VKAQKHIPRRAEKQRTWRPIAGLVALTAVVSAAITFWLDPSVGRRRRATARDRAGALVRRTGRRLTRWQRTAAATAFANTQKLRHLRRGSRPVADDVTLKGEVESALARNRELSRLQILVDVFEGIVTLRGQVEHPEQMREAESSVRRLPAVCDVHTLLHLPGTPAPNKVAALRASAGAAQAASAR